MKYPTILFILITFLAFSCKGQNKKSMVEKKSKTTTPRLVIKSEQEEDFSNDAKLFAEELLKENLSTHSYKISDSENPLHLHIFSMDNLESLTAYSNIQNHLNISPTAYTHFTLFVATYQSTEAAKNAFKRITSDAKYGLAELKNLKGDLATRVKALTSAAKHGGLITQNGKQVFSLSETCGKPPLKGDWHGYESWFMKFITNKDGEIQVLKAGCGEDRYYGGLRVATAK